MTDDARKAFALVQKAEGYMQTGQINKALDALELAHHKSPAEYVACAYARAKQQIADNESALELLGPYLETGSAAPGTLATASISLIALGERERAKKLARTASIEMSKAFDAGSVQNTPQSTKELLVVLGALRIFSLHREILDLCTSAQTVFPKHCSLVRGMAAFNQKRFSEARSAWSKDSTEGVISDWADVVTLFERKIVPHFKFDYSADTDSIDRTQMSVSDWVSPGWRERNSVFLMWALHLIFFSLEPERAGVLYTLIVSQEEWGEKLASGILRSPDSGSWLKDTAIAGLVSVGRLSRGDKVRFRDEEGFHTLEVGYVDCHEHDPHYEAALLRARDLENQDRLYEALDLLQNLSAPDQWYVPAKLEIAGLLIRLERWGLAAAEIERLSDTLGLDRRLRALVQHFRNTAPAEMRARFRLSAEDDMSQEILSDYTARIKLTIKGSAPPAWRRLLVPDDISLEQLHRVIQYCAGSGVDRLYRFVAGKTMYGTSRNHDVIDATGISLADLLVESDRLQYISGAKDGFVCGILLEEAYPEPARLAHARCVGGKRAFTKSAPSLDDLTDFKNADMDTLNLKLARYDLSWGEFDGYIDPFSDGYPGDSVFAGLLHSSGAVMPLHRVKTLLLGALSGVVVPDVSAAIDTIWEGKPECYDLDEAERLLDAFVSLWDLQELVAESGSFVLERMTPPEDMMAVETYARVRKDEIAGFVSGLDLAGTGFEDLSTASREAFDMLGMADMVTEHFMALAARRPIATVETIREAAHSLLDNDRTIQNSIDIIMAEQRIRRRTKAIVRAQNNVVPIESNLPCPCGSGKRYKDCCGKKRDKQR